MEPSTSGAEEDGARAMEPSTSRSEQTTSRSEPSTSRSEPSTSRCEPPQAAPEPMQQDGVAEGGGGQEQPPVGRVPPVPRRRPEGEAGSPWHMVNQPVQLNAAGPSNGAGPSSGGKNQQPAAAKGKDLGPCAVCGLPAAGYHFGAFTCEGCKSFYGRQLIKDEDKRPVCTKGGGCDVRGSKHRRSCRGCRYSKCLQVNMKRENSLFGRRSANFCYQTPGTPASPVGPGDGPDPTGSPALKTYKSEKKGEEAQLQHQPADERDLEQSVNQQQQQQRYRQQHQEDMAPQQPEEQNSPPEQHLRQQDQVLQEEEDDQMLLAEELRQRELYIHELQLRAHRIQEERRRLHEELRKEQELLEDKERDQQMLEWIRREQERRRREQREWEAWEELNQRDRDYSPPGRGLQELRIGGGHRYNPYQLPGRRVSSAAAASASAPPPAARPPAMDPALAWPQLNGYGPSAPLPTGQAADGRVVNPGLLNYLMFQQQLQMAQAPLPPLFLPPLQPPPPPAYLQAPARDVNRNVAMPDAELQRRQQEELCPRCTREPAKCYCATSDSQPLDLRAATPSRRPDGAAGRR